MTARDRSPIDQQWVQRYCNEFLKIAEQLGENSILHAAVLRRVECVMDLIEAWQKRNEPKA